jgi:hypothetical protein
VPPEPNAVPLLPAVSFPFPPPPPYPAPPARPSPPLYGSVGLNPPDVPFDWVLLCPSFAPPPPPPAMTSAVDLDGVPVKMPDRPPPPPEPLLAVFPPHPTMASRDVWLLDMGMVALTSPPLPPCVSAFWPPPPPAPETLVVIDVVPLGMETLVVDPVQESVTVLVGVVDETLAIAGEISANDVPITTDKRYDDNRRNCGRLSCL